MSSATGAHGFEPNQLGGQNGSRHPLNVSIRAVQSLPRDEAGGTQAFKTMTIDGGRAGRRECMRMA
ncbi:MAG: hypothetical protein ACREEE_01990 [Dongiaceae bacterium]